MEFLRGVLGLIGVGCAYMAGRSLIAVRKGWQKKRSLYAWAIRTGACLVAVSIRHPFDIAEAAVYVLAVAAFGLAVWNTSRERKREDLTDVIFPNDK